MPFEAGAPGAVTKFMWQGRAGQAPTPAAHLVWPRARKRTPNNMHGATRTPQTEVCDRRGGARGAVTKFRPAVVEFVVPFPFPPPGACSPSLPPSRLKTENAHSINMYERQITAVHLYSELQVCACTSCNRTPMRLTPQRNYTRRHARSRYACAGAEIRCNTSQNGSKLKV